MLFYMMLIWKDQGKKNKRKSNGSSASGLPFEEFNEEDDVIRLEICQNIYTTKFLCVRILHIENA